MSAQNYTKWKLPKGAKVRLGKGTINKITYSPDGNHIAVASSIGIWVYDAYTGEELDLLTGHEDVVTSIVYSPDGSTIASESYDGTVRLWDAATGKHKITLQEYGSSIHSIVYSSAGDTIASIGLNGVELWDTKTGQVRVPLIGHTNEVISIVYSPDGGTIVSKSRDDTMRLWDAVTGEQKSILTHHADKFSSVIYSLDSETIASASLMEVQLWDAMTGEHKNTLKGHMGKIHSDIMYFLDNGTLASAGLRSYNRTVKLTIRLWDTVIGKHKATLIHHVTKLTTGDDRYYSVVYSPDGVAIASASLTEVQLWDAATGKHKATLGRHTSVVVSVAYSPDGQTVASASFGEIRLWNATTGEHKATLKGHTVGVCSVAYSPDGKTVASASDTAKMVLPGGGTVGIHPDTATVIKLWDALTGEHKATLIHCEASSVVYSPDGGTIASAGFGEVQLWDALTGEHKVTLTNHEFVVSVVYSPDGNTIAGVSSDDSTVWLWDVLTGEHKATLQGDPGMFRSDEISPITYSPDGGTLASVSFSEIWLWDTTTGGHKATLQGHMNQVCSVAYSPDGTTLASASRSTTLKGDGLICEIWLWDTVTGEHKATLALGAYIEEEYIIQEYIVQESEKSKVSLADNGIYSVAYSPDGSTITAGSKDGTVVLWDAVTGKHKATFTGHIGGIDSVAYNSDGKVIATGGKDGTALLWESASTKVENLVPNDEDDTGLLQEVPSDPHQHPDINPQEIHGNWRAGWALDIHTLLSRPLPGGGYDTERTEFGEWVFQLKYRHDKTKIQPIAEIAAKFVKENFAVDGHLVLPYITAIIPIPPSDINRAFQPVTEVAQEIGKLLSVPVRTDYLTKVKRTEPLKNLPDVESKREQLRGAFVVESQDLKNRCVLLVDDLYDSGTTLTEATKVLYEQGGVQHVLVLTLTRTRTGRD